MIFNEIDFSNLPARGEEAFVEFVKAIDAEYSKMLRNDYEMYTDQAGDYNGSYEPQRHYVSAIIAFLDEYGISSELEDISDLPNQHFSPYFDKFRSGVVYLLTRFKLRQSRIASGSIGTLIQIDSDYKSEIGSLLDTIRKIVNQEIPKSNKKDNIMAKIASLQSEIDRDQTTIDALFGRLIEFSQMAKQASDQIPSLKAKIEKLRDIILEKSKKVDQLPKPDRPKLIAKGEISDDANLDDEIPF